MTDENTQRPSQLDLEAFMDHELTPSERTRVGNWLLDNPDQLRSLDALRYQDEKLREYMKFSLAGESKRDGYIFARRVGKTELASIFQRIILFCTVSLSLLGITALLIA